MDKHDMIDQPARTLTGSRSAFRGSGGYGVVVRRQPHCSMPDGGIKKSLNDNQTGGRS